MSKDLVLLIPSVGIHIYTVCVCVCIWARVNVFVCICICLRCLLSFHSFSANKGFVIVEGLCNPFPAEIVKQKPSVCVQL